MESIPPAHVAWLADTSNRDVVTGPPGWESIPGLLKRFTNSGSVFCFAEKKSCPCVALTHS
jgi:hypothetical protein